jgi:pimeloyl-ACP methyl ester carboxylesterase
MTRGSGSKIRSVLTAIAFAYVCGSITPAIAHDGINWGSCPALPDGYPDVGQQQCALIPVPLDYRRPDGRKVNIAVSRISAADPAKRRGVLFLNSGGPGGQGLNFPHLAMRLFPQSILDAYDLIGFDPRGVGRSAPVTCGLTDEQAAQAIPQLEQDHSFEKTAAFARFVADACAGAKGDTLSHFTTANTARDMDAIRAALGERSISYFAWSYGTYLGAVYASLFPSRADRFVLDSVVNPDWVWRDQFRSWGPAGEARFADFATYAVENEGSLHFGHTADEVRSLYFTLLAKAAANPINFEGSTIDAPMFRLFSLSFLYNDGSFPAMVDLWQHVRDGVSDEPTTTASPDPAEFGFPEIPSDNTAMSAAAVLCDDIAWPRSVEKYRNELQADDRRFPMFGQLGSNIWACAFWRAPNVEVPVKLSSNGPPNHILLLNTLRDPATPLPGATRVRDLLGQRSRLILVDGGGHAIFGLMDNSCATETVTTYLADGVFPSKDATCPANPDAQAAVTSANAASARADNSRDRARKTALRQLRPVHR